MSGGWRLATHTFGGDHNGPAPPTLGAQTDRRGVEQIDPRRRQDSVSSVEERRRMNDGSRDETKKKIDLSPEQRVKFTEQKKQYEESQNLLTNQLMKLKEQREALKSEGAKHEDSIMKENARLQKEVKVRLQQMQEVIDKIELALTQAVPSSGYQEEEDGKLRASRSPSRSKKKKKKKAKDRSSSEEDSDREKEKEKKKKRKKKKKKVSSSSSSSSDDSDGEQKVTPSKPGVIQVDETMLRVLADSKSSKKKKGSDDKLMDLLAKMSEAYMKSKQDNAELAKRIKVLESENFVLKKQLAEKDTLEKTDKRKKDEGLEKQNIMQQAQLLLDQTQRKFETETNVLLDTQHEVEERRNVKRLSTPEDQRSESEERESKRIKQDDLDLYDREDSRERQVREDSRERFRDGSRHRDGSRERHRDHSRERYHEEGREKYPDRYDDRHGDRERFGDHRREYFRGNRGRWQHPGGRGSRDFGRFDDRNKRFDRRFDNRRGFHHDRPFHDDRRRQYEDDRYDRRREDRDRSHERDRSPERQREGSYGRVISSPRSKSPSKRSKEDKINLDEWSDKPKGEGDVEASSEFASLKQKMKLKEERDRQKEEFRKRWTVKEDKPSEEREMEKNEKSREPPKAPLPSGPRPQVALQWGQGNKKVTESSEKDKKKVIPVIGKMPGLNRSKKTPDKDRASSITREDSLEQQRQNLKQQQAQYSQMGYYGLTSEMYMQAINATMPSEPPPPTVNVMSLFPPQPPPKNPKPADVDINSILAAAQQHISQKKVELGITTQSDQGKKNQDEDSDDGDIPLPPLPAAMDKDPDALLDTRPPKDPTPPPPPKQKTELDIMLEKHQQNEKGDSNGAGNAGDDDEEMDPTELEMLGIDPSDFAGFGAK